MPCSTLFLLLGLLVFSYLYVMGPPSLLRD